MTTTRSALDRLPAAFRYSEAVSLISERALRQLLDEQAIERIGRGTYRRRDAIGDEALMEIATRAPRATICLRSALVHHGLLDDIPALWDIAIPRGDWAPETQARVTWRRFALETFHIGREQLVVGPDVNIGLYSAERSIVDAYRLRHN
jgi:predicted transcriptional regulator of viral defense system